MSFKISIPLRDAYLEEPKLQLHQQYDDEDDNVDFFVKTKYNALQGMLDRIPSEQLRGFIAIVAFMFILLYIILKLLLLLKKNKNSESGNGDGTASDNNLSMMLQVKKKKFISRRDNRNMHHHHL